MEKCKICKNKEAEHTHHLVPRAKGGNDDPENLIRICSDCHYRQHHPEWKDGDIDQFRETFDAAIQDDVFSLGWGIIPNKVLRDKDISPFAKILYCEVSSLSAARGYCWASNAYLAEKMGTASRTISRALTELEKYLVFENRMTPNRRIWIHRSSGVTKNPVIKKEPKVLKETRTSGNVINEVIDLFKEVNPSVNLLFKRKNQREAVDRMVEQHGREKIESIIKFLPRSNGHRYAPKITTPVELEEKFGKLIAWAEAEKQGKGSSNKGKKILI